MGQAIRAFAAPGLFPPDRVPSQGSHPLPPVATPPVWGSPGHHCLPLGPQPGFPVSSSFRTTC